VSSWLVTEFERGAMYSDLMAASGGKISAFELTQLVSEAVENSATYTVYAVSLITLGASPLIGIGSGVLAYKVDKAFD
jgi:hypothetical protein